MPRLVKPLTNTEIEKAKPNAQKKKFTLNDGNGLFLLVKPNGSKLWRFNYSKPFINTRTEISLGKYPDITLSQARILRSEYLALLAQDIDPQTHRQEKEQAQQQKQANNFLAIAEQWKKKKTQEVEPLTLKKGWRRLEIHLFPTIANMPIIDVTPSKVIPDLDLLDKKGNGTTLRRVIQLLNEVLSFAVISGVIPFNPCQNLKDRYSFGKPTNNPTIRPEELPELIKRLYHSNVTLFARNLIFWQLLTMTRPSESSNAEWAEIDFDRQVWTIPAERMKMRKSHAIPLSSQAMKLLVEMKGYTGKHRYLFQSLRNPTKPMSEQTANKALRDLGYANKLTAHGLRSIASTYLNEQLINFDVVEACLSHGIKDQVRKAYNRSDYFNQRIAVMQQWGDFVEQCGMIFLP